MIRRVSPATVVAVSAVFWGLWWLPLRSLDATGLGPMALNLWLYVVAALALLPVLWALRTKALAGGPALLLSAGLFGIAILAWNGALQTGEVVRVTLLFFLMPVWATVLGRLFLAEPMGGRRIAAICFGVGGALVLLAEAWPPVPKALGDWLGLLSGMLFAGSATAARYGRVDGRVLTALAFLIGAGLAATVVALGPEPALPPSPAVLLPVAAVALCWLMPITWAQLWGSARLDPGRLALLMLLEVVAAAVSAALLTDEPFGLREAAGCVLILAAGALEATGQTAEPTEIRRSAT
jgi:drug/metabolite transporter (DMT)-like permease